MRAGRSETVVSTRISYASAKAFSWPMARGEGIVSYLRSCGGPPSLTPGVHVPGWRGVIDSVVDWSENVKTACLTIAMVHSRLRIRAKSPSSLQVGAFDRADGGRVAAVAGPAAFDAA